MQYFTNWFRFHQARSFLFSCAPYKELNWTRGHLDVTKITRSILPVLPATAFLLINKSLHTTAVWTTPLSLLPNSYNRLIQERRATASWYYGLTCTLKCHSYATVRISPVKLFHLDFYLGSNGVVSRPFFRYPNLRLHIHKFRFRLHRRMPQRCNKYTILYIPSAIIYFPSAAFTYKNSIMYYSNNMFMYVKQPAPWIYLLNTQ